MNSLLIQQMMNMQQQQQQNQQQQQASERSPEQQEAKKESALPQSEGELKELGYKMFKCDKDAKDNIVIKNPMKQDYEVEIWAVDKKGVLSCYGTINVNARGYKGNPFDTRPNKYKAIWMKCVSEDNVEITNLGEKSDDQVFEIR